MDQSKKNTYVIAAVVFVALLVGIYFLFIFKKGPSQIKSQDNQATDVKQITDIELAKRPYITLTPTSDGAEVIISIENMGAFDRIEYELTYQADNPTSPGTKIERGATGTDINTKDPKYKKDILLGTASRGVRNPDTGVTEGKLALHMFKGDTQYDSQTPWDLVSAGLAAASISDRGNNITLKLPALGKNYWIILADTLGIPKGGTFDVKNVTLPVYGAFSIAPTFPSPVNLTLKSGAASPTLFAYNLADQTWQKVDSTYASASKTLTATINNFATFVVTGSK
ncbi:MAG: hypothetical protein Q7S45_04725 [Candidatus Curtissbacteria bacterium]|nr:hypothetical protein [Candidatus Curtissbacteria bacterium]